jgi:hypothetical protein
MWHSLSLCDTASFVAGVVVGKAHKKGTLQYSSCHAVVPSSLGNNNDRREEANRNMTFQVKVADRRTEALRDSLPLQDQDPTAERVKVINSNLQLSSLANNSISKRRKLQIHSGVVS